MGKKFAKDYQPDPAAKALGHFKKKDFQFWLDHFTQMPYGQFVKMLDFFQKYPDSCTATQLMAAKYVVSCVKGQFKFLADYQDRVFGKPVQKSVFELNNKQEIDDAIQKIKTVLDNEPEKSDT